MIRVMTFHRAFVLTGALLAVAGVVAGQSRAKKDNDPDVKEMRDYRLNMDVIQRYLAAFKAINNDAAAKKCVDNNSPGNAPTLDAGEKLLNACAPAVADLKTAGLKPREFLIVTAALIGDFMAVGMKKSGAIKEYPDSMSPENATFIEQNYAKLQSMLAPLTGSDK
jgi:hypothetical protein